MSPPALEPCAAPEWLTDTRPFRNVPGTVTLVATEVQNMRFTTRLGRSMRAVAVLLPAAAVLACADASSYRPLQAGDQAPDFAAPRLDGDTVRLSELRGQPVLLNIWATWCPPCREEMPGLQALHERYGDRLRVLGVSIDSPGADGAVREFVREYGVSFTILHDPAERVTRQYRTIGVPETFLIDGAGRIAHRWIGKFDPLAPDELARIEAVLPR
jgi:peroxiredoxin